MKTALAALVLVCGVLLPDFWIFVPAFRNGVQSFFDRINSCPPIWIFGMIIAVLLIDTWMLQRPARRSR